MIQYIYFVKCPNCEDEHFDFFDEAKAFAMGCLSQKPIITQTEVCRNDFGECTDHSDLGQVWSWEDECGDAEGGYTEAEPTKSIFTKDDLKPWIEDEDPEFDNIDNSVDPEVEEPVTSEISAVDEIPDNFRKPIPEGMTIEELVEEMEENEDTVECTWCEELFDKSECRYEVDLGWLCSRCEMAIKSRGETLTFREGNYWDFLDEKLNLDIDFSNCVNSSDVEIWGLEPTDDPVRFKGVLMKRFKDVSFRGPEDELQKVVDEMYDIGGVFTFSFGKDGLPELNSWNVNLLRKLGRIGIDFEDLRYEDAIATVFNRRAVTESTKEPEELHDLGNEYDGGYPADNKLAELEEAADYRKRLTPCPECGTEDVFDHETGICINCGFTL